MNYASLTSKDDSAKTARERAMAYLAQSDASSPADSFQPHQGGWNAFSGDQDFAIQADMAGNALGAAIDRRGTKMAADYTKDMANIQRLNAKAAAGKQNGGIGGAMPFVKTGLKVASSLIPGAGFLGGLL